MATELGKTMASLGYTRAKNTGELPDWHLLKVAQGYVANQVFTEGTREAPASPDRDVLLAKLEDEQKHFEEIFERHGFVQGEAPEEPEAPESEPEGDSESQDEPEEPADA